jgi:hypothetical protein
MWRSPKSLTSSSSFFIYRRTDWRRTPTPKNQTIAESALNLPNILVPHVVNKVQGGLIKHKRRCDGGGKLKRKFQKEKSWK